MEKEAFVYKWVNLTNGKYYIGYHKGSLGDGYVSSSHNYNFWGDFNNPNMEWDRQILFEGSKYDCLKFEQDLLRQIDIRSSIVYNNARGSEIIFTENVLDKMSKSNKKRWENMSEESRIEHSRKISEIKKGVPRPKEVCEKLSELYKGKSFIERYGEEKSKLIGKKISDSNKGQRYHSEEHKKNLSDRMKGNDYGKYQKEETKEVKRKFFTENNPGKNKTEITKKRIGDSNRGKPSKLKGVEHKKIKCPFCNKEGGNGIMKRWHFDKCKNK